MKDTTNKAKVLKRALRRNRVRSVVNGTSIRPRLSVFRSNQHLYAQLIDDDAGKTLVATSSKDSKATGAKLKQAVALGTALAEKAKTAGITKVVFDRGGYRYHGRVKELADACRAAGLEF